MKNLVFIILPVVFFTVWLLLQYERYRVAIEKTHGFINVLDYGAIGDGKADDTTAFAEAFVDAKRYKKSVIIPQNTYLLSAPLRISNEMNIKSYGATIKYIGTDSAFIANNVDDWNLNGPLTINGVGLKEVSGILISGANRYNLDNITIRHFADRGIWLTGGSPSRAARGNRGKFTAVSLIDNHIGLDIEPGTKYSPEYNLFTLMTFSGNDIAAIVGSGNNIMTASNIVDNLNGIELKPGENDGHGIFSAVNINHNRGYNIHAKGLKKGYSFIGCHIYGDSDSQGIIDIEDSPDINFNAGIIKAFWRMNGKTLSHY